MKALVIFVLLCFMVQSALSQFIENFDDGDFTHNPVWVGDSVFFQVNDSNELQSLGPGISTEIYLSSNFEMSPNSIWEFEAKLDFATSSSNYARFYLSANQTDLKNNLHGYYIKLGGESGSDDGIDLYLQQDAIHTKIIDGLPGFFGRDSNAIQIKVIKSFPGEWTLFADTSLQNNYVFQGQTHDNSIAIKNNLGFYCKHSSTRSDKFYFDNIEIRDGPFELIECSALNDSTIEVIFSNPIDTFSGANPANYFISNGISILSANYFQDSFPNRIILYTDKRLNAGNYTLSLSNISDRQNQWIQYDSCTFSFYPLPEISKLLFNELMYDPIPVVGMPDVEYVELLNISSGTVNLKGIKYSDATTEITFSEVLLDSGEQLILCSIEDTALFQWYGNVYGLDTWPSLNNSGDVLTLLSPENIILDQIAYDAGWSDGSAKDEGGWSFERINPFKKCTDNQNWAYSLNSAGGTPGELNSVYNPTPDLSGPKLELIEVFNSTYLRLQFDEILKSEQNPLNFIRLEPINQINSFLILENFIELSLLNPLDSGIINQMRIDSVFDCEGNLSLNLNASFGIGKSPALFDLVISEIMIDPEPQNSLPSTEYIELFNTSDNIISFNSLFIISEEDSATLPAISIYPGEYLILCPSSKFEEMSEIAKAVKLSPWTSLKNNEDKIYLKLGSITIHKVHYSADWIRDTDKREGGWSLEMMDTNNPCAEESNWDASIDPDGGTPGRINSIQYDKPDLLPAQINNIEIISNTELDIHFNEWLDFSYLHLGNINIDPDNEVKAMNSDERISKKLILTLDKTLKNNTVYTLSLAQIADCVHNFSDLEKTFILPESPEKNDLIINEILFNPPQDVSEYIEIYNRSSKNINLENTILTYYNFDGQLKSQNIISEENYVINAFEFLTLCEDSISIIQHFPKRGSAYLELSSFPTLTNESGQISIIDSNHVQIDSVLYAEEFHFELIDDVKGVSLERVSSEISGLQTDNWASASESFGFGSPGLLNSKSIERLVTDDFVHIEPLLFSPDGDGYKDLLHIRFNTDISDAIVNINIYDTKGNLVKNLANNSTLAYSNDFIWDGINDYGEKSKIGNYIILFDLFDLEGNRNKIKKVFSLGGQI
ncbi:lamin tail domain-containing protein [Hyphobacterium sp. CCMP332]|nr:lamin tail domain-containing protein [Hyphobacterium sp. CCMP332]